MSNVKSASVIIKPVTSPEDYMQHGNPASTSFFFNHLDSGLVNFVHSLGFEKATTSHYLLEVVDPGSDFIYEFIASHYFNRSANSDVVSKAYSISYGIGKEKTDWSVPQLAYLININWDIRSDGSRKYVLKFGSLPSLRNLPGGSGWPAVDMMGRTVVTAGLSSYEKDPAGMSTKTVEGWVQFVDKHANNCIRRYLENITGLGPTAAAKSELGNVIVVLPSFKYTRMVAQINKILALPPKSQLAKMEFTDKLNKYMLGGFPNLTAYALVEYAVHAGLSTSLAMMQQRQYKDIAKNKNLGAMCFQSSNMKAYNISDKTKKVTSVDWSLPLKSFGDQFSKMISHIDLEYIKGLPKYGTQTKLESPLTKGKVVRGTIHDNQNDTFRTWRSVTNFGTFGYREIHDPRRLLVLQEYGLIARAIDYCVIWGELTMIDLMLSQLPNSQENMDVAEPTHHFTSRTRQQRKGVYSSTTEAKYYQGILKMFSKDSLNPLINFVNNPKALEKLSELSLLIDYEESKNFRTMVKTTASDVRSVISGGFMGNALDVGGQIVPVVRSGVANSNVTDLRIQMSPLYWGALAGTVDEMVRVYKKRDSVVVSFEKGVEDGTDEVSKQIHEALGFKRDDPGFKKWIGKVKKAIEEITIGKGIYNKKGRVERKNMGGRSALIGSDSNILDPLEQQGSYGYYTRGTKGGKGSTLAWMEGSPIYEAVMAIPIPKDWQKPWQPKGGAISLQAIPYPGEGDPPSPLAYDLMMHVMSNFVVPSRRIFNKISKGQAAADLFTQTSLFYEKVYRLSGPQLDATLYPMFFFSMPSTLGRPVYVHMRQPSVLEGINTELDRLAIDKKIRGQYSDLGSGMYYLAAFEHTIRNDKVESRFRLVKNAYDLDEEGFQKHLLNKQRKKTKHNNKIQGK